MRRLIVLVALALFAVTATASGPAGALAEEYRRSDACDVWQPDANPGPEWDADAAEPGLGWDADGQPGPEWDADAAEPGPEWDPQNGACGANDEDPTDSQPTNGPLETLFSLLGW